MYFKEENNLNEIVFTLRSKIDRNIFFDFLGRNNEKNSGWIYCLELECTIKVDKVKI